MAEDYRQCVRLAKHYKAIGSTRIYLSRDSGPFPWEHVTAVEEGGTYRLDCCTSISFTAKHPSGLTFSWSIDIEDRSANGLGHFRIDTARLQSVLDSTPEKSRRLLRKYFAAIAEAVEKRALEYEQVARVQRAAVAELVAL